MQSLLHADTLDADRADQMPRGLLGTGALLETTSLSRFAERPRRKGVSPERCDGWRKTISGVEHETRLAYLGSVARSAGGRQRRFLAGTRRRRYRRDSAFRITFGTGQRFAARFNDA